MKHQDDRFLPKRQTETTDVRGKILVPGEDFKVFILISRFRGKGKRYKSRSLVRYCRVVPTRHSPTTPQSRPSPPQVQVPLDVRYTYPREHVRTQRLYVKEDISGTRGRPIQSPNTPSSIHNFFESQVDPRH